MYRSFVKLSFITLIPVPLILLTYQEVPQVVLCSFHPQPLMHLTYRQVRQYFIAMIESLINISERAT